MKKEQRAMHLDAKGEKVVLFTYLWIQYKKKKYKRKERSIRSINPLKLIKRVKNVGESKV